MAAPLIGAGDYNTWLGTFGEKWVMALCAAAGCPVSKLEPDVVGTDLVIHNPAHELIRAQVKATESLSILRGAVHFALDVPTYNRLRGGATHGYLFVVGVRAPSPRWTGHTQHGSVVRSVAYWARIDGPAPIQKVSITIALPLSAMLTPTSLLTLF